MSVLGTTTSGLGPYCKRRKIFGTRQTVREEMEERKSLIVELVEAELQRAYNDGFDAAVRQYRAAGVLPSAPREPHIFSD